MRTSFKYGPQDKSTEESFDTTEAVATGSSPPQQAIKIVKVPAAKSAATVRRDPSDILAKPKRTYSQLISEALLNAQNKSALHVVLNRLIDLML